MSVSSVASSNAISTSPLTALGTQSSVLHSRVSSYVLKDEINLSKAAVALIANAATDAANQVKKD